MKMTPLRKQAFAWLAALTAITVSALAGSFIYLREEIPTDPAYIETRTTHVAVSQGFDIEGAKKENYSEQEIASYLVKANQAKFDRQWFRVLTIIGSLYCVLALGIFAVVLRKEAKP
ncbi:MAG: hypothetical protein Q8L56_06645 [Rhodocyclaceae bacterium]|nr:hypothetical protein [Rhodocyclaceae bacterium]